MKKRFVVPMLITIFSLVSILSYTQEEAERRLILRHAQERGDTTVAVEAYLTGDILETTIYVRMYGTKPSIYNAILVGPRLGRLSPRTKNLPLS